MRVHGWVSSKTPTPCHAHTHMHAHAHAHAHTHTHTHTYTHTHTHTDTQALHVCGIVGTAGGTGCVMEFAGSAIAGLSMEARMVGLCMLDT